MDSLEHDADIDAPLRQKTKKESGSRLERTVLKFTRFQIGIAVLQLIPVCMEATSGMAILSLLAFFLLAPLFVISVIIELITVIVIKITHKTSNIEKRKFSIYEDSATEDVETSGQNYQTKRLKPLAKAFAILFSIFGITIILYVSNMFLPRYSAISDVFSEEEKVLGGSPYHTKIIKKDFDSGTMTVQLDDDISYDYVCQVSRFGLDSGYGPFCNYHFPDGSESIGEYIFHRNYDYLQELVIKYQDALTVDDSKYQFKIKVIDQEIMETFFSELMENADFNKAFEAFKNSNDSGFSSSLNHIYLENAEYKNREYGYTSLFEWAKLVGF